MGEGEGEYWEEKGGGERERKKEWGEIKGGQRQKSHFKDENTFGMERLRFKIG